VAAATGLTPLVGRESEVELLLERWAQSTEGQGQVVLLSGESGIGKSRLVEVMQERVIGEGAQCIVLRCSPYHTHSVLYPVIEHLQRWLQFQRDDNPEEKLRKLEEALAHTPLPPNSLSLRERVRVRGDSSQFSAPSPLTPALSQGERENRSIDWRNARPRRRTSWKPMTRSGTFYSSWANTLALGPTSSRASPSSSRQHSEA